jgi:homoaconitase/3-isopropylmalate dehydratase large subunit
MLIAGGNAAPQLLKNHSAALKEIMGRNIVEKVLQAHLREGDYVPGNGICHQVHLERFGKPGTTLLGADSHTPTGGGIGQIAIGAGGLDVAVAMGGGPFHLTCPKVYQVRLSGKLREWVSAKDVVLHMLSILTTKGNEEFTTSSWQANRSSSATNAPGRRSNAPVRFPKSRPP